MIRVVYIERSKEIYYSRYIFGEVGYQSPLKGFSLITQKWIALFPDGQEGWNEIRRTGYPKVFPVAQSTSGYTIKVPNRIPFDSDELINNRASYEEAVQMLGGADNYATKMWWQKK